MVQVPRIYRIFRKIEKVKSLQDILNNFFEPLFAATLEPEKHPELARLLTEISGFDSVDDESIHESQDFEYDVKPSDWTSLDSPSYVIKCITHSYITPNTNTSTQQISNRYAYQLYYFYANTVVLNRLRESRGMNTFELRPHCGEAGNVLHLAVSYLLSQGVNHGIRLGDQPALQYLYYIDQIGIAVSPISNNFLFLRFADSPFFKFFKRGLNVSLSTDDPLLFHMSDDPLLEEYAVARQVWNLSVPDVCEICRNSVIQSGYPDRVKAEWLGRLYHEHMSINLNISPKDMIRSYYPSRTNVPMIRAHYRCEQLQNEVDFLNSC